MKFRKISDLIAKGVDSKNIIMRVDYNVPLANGRISDDTRIKRTLTTIKALRDAGANVILISHFGRPDEGYDPALSLSPIADKLQELLGETVNFGSDCIGEPAKAAASKGGVSLLENLRFYKEEKKNDAEFSGKLAEVGDYFVNEAFSCSHRKHASIFGITEHLESFAGLALEDELNNLSKVLDAKDRPFVAVVGGSKVSTKIEVLRSLVNKVDKIIIGGAMANTFLAAKGYGVGKSLHEPDHIETAKEIMQGKAEIILPEDVTCASEFGKNVGVEICAADAIPDDKLALDIGALTIANYADVMRDAKMVVWNGPLGAYEYSPFDVGTLSLVRVVAYMTTQGKMQSIAGGGDILSAVSKAGLSEYFTYISTAGGAFLEWLEGKELPGIKALT